jgi:hypothetical protein
MKLMLAALVLGVSLSGCAGITYYGHSDAVVSKTDFSPVNSFQDREKPPSRAPDKQYSDGTVMYVLQNETVWCGPTIWAVIPVPLLLPLCRDHTEMIYKDGHPIQMTYQGTGFTSVAICGPGLPLLSVFGGRVGFCMFEKK